jgi:FAD:protein FMN transferase
MSRAIVYQYQFDAIGTRWVIDLYDCPPFFESRLFEQKIKQRIDEYDKVYSRFRSDSLVTQISEVAGKYTFPDDSKDLFDIYKRVYDITGGKVTPLIGTLMEQTGYDASYSLIESQKKHQVPDWDDTLAFDFPTLTTKSPTLLDFGAAGKGHCIDIVSEIIKEIGISEFCVDAGGDICYFSKSNTEIVIGLEDPKNQSNALGTITLLNSSLCGSSGNRRVWSKYHHIMDPDTKVSTNDVLATWVCAESTIVADALATCLFFVNPSLLIKEFTFDYVILYPDYSTESSKSTKIELFT